MSNDLISRSALLREMTDRTFRNALHEFRHYQNMVKNMPTAYDVDKVVEQIEASSTEGIVLYVDKKPLITKESAEKIVKSGGIG